MAHDILGYRVRQKSPHRAARADHLFEIADAGVQWARGLVHGYSSSMAPIVSVGVVPVGKRGTIAARCRLELKCYNPGARILRTLR